MATQTTCPVCHMDVDPQNAPTADFNGEQYHFCSEGCREQFLQDPERYVPSA